MASLNALKKAPILNEAGVQLVTQSYTAVSSDAAVARVTTSGYGLFATGVAAGHAILTATRILDGAVATLPVDVVAASPFSISLGAEVAA